MASLEAVGVPLLIIALLIGLNALFVAAEFAIVGVPKAAIAARAGRGDRLAKLVLDVLEDPRKQDQFIATAQLGITVASLGLGMYGEHVLAHWIEGALAGLGGWVAAHGLATFLAIAILTYFHIVVGEMVPKSIALQRAETAARWVMPPMLAVKAACYPLVIGMNALGNAFLRGMGVERKTDHGEHLLSPEELQLVVQESGQGGMIRPDASQMLVELFEFGELTAGEAMVPRVAAHGIPVGASAAELERLLQAHPHTRYPVYEHDLDHVVGVVHVKQVMGCVVANRGLAPADVREVPRVASTTPLDVVLAAMRAARTQLVVVMDEHGGTAGVLTIEDLFEEVAGEIAEGPETPAPSDLGAKGRHRFPGTARLDEVGERLGVALHDDHVDTISGLVLMRLNRPPKAGDVVHYENLEIEVDQVAHFGVQACFVRLVEPT